MSEGPDIARVAALVGDPARSAMLLALMDGRALTATELATLAGVTKQTASSHLARLLDGDLLAVEAQGRHRYFRLSGPHVGALIEALMVFSTDPPEDPPKSRTGVPRKAPRSGLRTGPRDPALRKARVCYDHLAGEFGVLMFDRMALHGWLDTDGPALTVTPAGWQALDRLGLTQDDLPRSNRPLCRACLDWSMRRHHLAGQAGKLILDRLLEMDWARRQPGSRVVDFTPDGERRFRQWLAA